MAYYDPVTLERLEGGEAGRRQAVIDAWFRSQRSPASANLNSRLSLCSSWIYRMMQEQCVSTVLYRVVSGQP